MDKYYSPESSKRDERFVVGTAGFHSWEIKTIAKGCQQIKGIYKRTWEKEASKEQTFKFYVKIIWTIYTFFMTELILKKFVFGSI